MKKYILLFLIMPFAFKGLAQSSPPPIYVIDGDASVVYAPYSEGTYPAGFIGWLGPNTEVAPSNPIPTTIQATGDATLNPVAAPGSTTHWSLFTFNNEGPGISWRANVGNNTPLALCMALNTKGCYGVKVTFTWGCKTNYVNNGKAAICFQYRVGNSGNWTNDSEATDARFSSTKTVQVKETKTITLPASCDNKDLVQVRWLVVRETNSAIGPGDRMHVDAVSYSATTRDAVIAPVAAFSFTFQDSVTVNFKDESQNLPTSHYWDFGDGIGTSTLQNPVYQYTAPGEYEVTLIVTNTSGSDTLRQPVQIGQTQGIAGHLKDAVQLFTSADKSSLTIETPDRMNDVEIYTALGQKVMALSNIQSNRIHMDINSLAKGLYIVRVHTGGLIFAKAFMRQ